MSAQQVGVPSNKRKTFVACVRNHPNAEERLSTRWKARLTDMRVRPVTLGEFIGREGSYFLNRKKGEQKIFSFEDSIMLLTRGHILGEKPPSSGYQPRSSDVNSLEDAQELHLTDSAKIATRFEDYIFPPTLDRGAIAALLVDSTPGGMMRAVISCLLATETLPKTPTIPPDWEQEGLSCAAFDTSHTDETTDEPNLATAIAPVVTRKGKQRILHHPQTSQDSRQPTPPASPGATPPPTPVAPPPRIRTKTQRDPGTSAVITRKGHPPTPQQSRQPPPPAPPGARPTPAPVSPHPRTLTRKQNNPGTSAGVTRKGKQRMRHHPPALQSRDNPYLRRHQKKHHSQHLWHHPHGLERESEGTRAHRTLCSPLKRPRRRLRQLLARANTKAHTQLWYNGSRTCSANRRN